MSSEITHAIVDVDGVLRREKFQIPGVPEFFAALHQSQIQAVVLSNNSRIQSSGLTATLQGMGVANDDMPGSLTSADATALWMQQNPSREKPIACVIGEKGLRMALAERGIPIMNDEDWNGKKWKQIPSDVVVGFDTHLDYSKLGPAFNALTHGARFVGTNPDVSFRNEEGEEMPANGAALAYLSTTGQTPTVIGKPGIGMAEVALARMRADKASARIAVVGDTADQDVALASNLRDAGWTVEAWAVLTGVLTADEAHQHPQIARVFADISAITRDLLQH